MARPILLNDEIALQIASALQAGRSIAVACDRAGVAPSTFHLWISRGGDGTEPFAKFAALVRWARAEGRKARRAAAKRPAPGTLRT